MEWVLFSLLVVFLIVGIVYLVKAIKEKNNEDWLKSFSLNVSFILGSLLIILYAIINHSLSWNALDYLVICLLAICVYGILLLVNTTFKVIEVMNNKKKKKKMKALEKSTKIKSILIPFVIIFLLSVIFCLIDYTKCVIEKREEINIYNGTRSSEIHKMAKHLNDKYELNINENNCIYYREEDYTYHGAFLGGGNTNNIPYIAVFKDGKEEITVVDRKGYISDNRQLKDINSLLTNYFYKKLGIKFDYIEFKEDRLSLPIGNHDYINRIIQNKFNDYIDEENIEELLKYILEENYVTIIFYTKEDIDKNIITEKLNYLFDYSSVDEVAVYGYYGELKINYDKKVFEKETMEKRADDDDYDDDYKFGSYYVSLGFKDYTYSLIKAKDTHYKPTTNQINGWRYNEFNKGDINEKE